ERAVAAGVFVASAGDELGGQGRAVAELSHLVVRDIAPRDDGLYGFGVYAQGAADLVTQSEVTVRAILIEEVFTAGLLALEAEANVLDSQVRAIATAESSREFGGEFGDGVVLQRYFVGAPPLAALIDGLVVEGVARAGVASFGADVALSNLLSSCNPIHLNGEANFEGLPYGYTVSGDNACGCGVLEECKVLSSGISPPPLLD
ncbi:MAG: hypothetical protein RIF41_33915, partial [Polyangiaceae bacterium]